MQIAKKMRLDSSAPRRDDDHDEDDEDQRTLFCTNLSENVTEELLYELFIQTGPIESVRIPKDKDGRPRQFGFVTYVHACSVPYALDIYTGIRLFNRDLIVRNRNPNSRNRNSDTRPAIENNMLDESPRYRPRTDDKRRFQLDSSSSLRGGHSGMNRFDTNMKPKSKFTLPPEKQQPAKSFQFDDLEQLGSKFLFNPFKAAGANSIDNLKDALSAGRGGNCGGEDMSIGKHSSRSNRPHMQTSPYQNKRPQQQMNQRGNSDQNRARTGDWNRSANRNQHRKRR